MPRVLHVLSQQPLLTGSGVTLDALVRQAEAAGWDQHAIVGAPRGAAPAVGPLSADRIHALWFEGGDLPHPVVGMSDVMPYPSRTFSSLTADEVEAYVDAWRGHLRRVVDRVRPEVVHSHHAWLVSSLVKEVAPHARLIVHCHGTGLRQRALCPHLAERAQAGLRRADGACALHPGQVAPLAEATGLPARAIAVVGAGYRDDLFGPGAGGAPPDPNAVVYAGKLADAKGLPWLLFAVEQVAARRPIVLHIAGGGDGAEADRIRARIAGLGSLVRYHGRLEQSDLADLYRRCAVFALPSLFEGLPLALVEAAACGCQIVATELPGVTGAMTRALGARLHPVPMPPLTGVDRVTAGAETAFVDHIAAALGSALGCAAHASSTPPADLSAFTWPGVFQRIQSLWTSDPCDEPPSAANQSAIGASGP